MKFRVVLFFQARELTSAKKVAPKFLEVGEDAQQQSPCYPKESQESRSKEDLREENYYPQEVEETRCGQEGGGEEEPQEGGGKNLRKNDCM